MASNPARRSLALTVALALLAAVASVALFATSQPVGAAFTGGAGTSWSVSATGPGGGAIQPGQPMTVVVTLVWDADMHAYPGNPCTLQGSTSDPRIPDMYILTSGADPSSALFPSCGVTQELSPDLRTATWTRDVTAPTSPGNYSVRAYSRSAPYFNSSPNFTYSDPFAYSVGTTTTTTTSTTTTSTTTTTTAPTTTTTAPTTTTTAPTTTTTTAPTTTTTTAPTTTTTTAPTTTTTAPTTATPAPGGPVELIVGDRRTTPEVDQRDDGTTLAIRGGGVELTIRSLDAGGDPRPLDDSGRLVVGRDGEIESSAAGYAPGSKLTMSMFSDPVTLGIFPVKADGTLSAAAVVPASVPLGEHTLQMDGIHDSASHTVRVAVLVVEDANRAVEPEGGSAPVPASLAYTGSEGWLGTLGVALLVAGCLVTVAATRRRP